MKPPLLQAMRHYEAVGTDYVCVTMAAARGSVPQELGAKMLVTGSGRSGGTIGGGRIEEAALAHAAALLANPSAPPCDLKTWNLQKDIGMTCGGEVGLLFELCRPCAWSIVLFGAGHVSQALVRILANLNCRVTVYDTRPEMLARICEAGHIQTRKQEDLAAVVPQLPDNAFVALMTQGHRSDRPILERILKTRQFPYLGVIGSASKAAVLWKELREAGVSAELRDAFRCPIGLPIGNDTPEEIALSIAAEMLQVRDEGKSGSCSLPTI